MILIRISAKLIEEQFVQGKRTPPLEIHEGLPGGCKLVYIDYQRGMPEARLYFQEPEEPDDKIDGIDFLDPPGGIKTVLPLIHSFPFYFPGEKPK